MKNSIKETEQKNRICESFLKVFDSIAGKYLFGLILINTFYYSKTVLDNVGSVYIYYTSNIGKVRPSAFLGLFSLLFPNYMLTCNILRVLYIGSVFLLSYALYLFLKKINNVSVSLLVILAVDITSVFIFENDIRLVMFISLLLSAALSLFAFYIMLFASEKRRFTAPVLAALAVLTDCRSVYLIILLCLIVLIKKNHEMALRSLCMITLGAALICGGALLMADGAKSDSADIKKLYTQRYLENADPEDMETLTIDLQCIPKKDLTASHKDLMFGDAAQICRTFMKYIQTDIFQRIVLVFAFLIIVYEIMRNRIKDKTTE